MVSPPSSVVPHQLRQLCDRLVGLQLLVGMSVETLCGEPDVRLRACPRNDPDLSVELLAPDPTIWSSRTWDAVRIKPGYRRLWRGPDENCPLDEVATFVCTLLRLDDAQLAQRYVDLG